MSEPAARLRRSRHRELNGRFFRGRGLVELVAGAASGLVRGVADFDLGIASRDALRVMRRTPATNADRMHLRDILGNREQGRHRSEWTPHVILIESGGDDADASVGELHADIDDARIEELDLIDADDLHSDLHPRQQLGARGDGMRLEPAVVARNDVLGTEAIIDQRLEDLDPLPRDHRTAHPPDQLFRLAGEHASGDDLDPAASVTVQGFLRGKWCETQDSKTALSRVVCGVRAAWSDDDNAR